MGELYNRLKGRRNQQGDLNFCSHISQVLEAAPRWLEGIGKNGIDHSRRVEVHLGRLIPEEIKKLIRPPELFLLLYAVYLHDIGYRREDGIIDSHDHFLRSRKYILENPARYLLGSFPRTADRAPLAAEAIGWLCYGHAPQQRCPLHSIPNDFCDEYLSPTPLNLRRLTALLRLADETDQAYIRLEAVNTVRQHIALPEIIPGKVSLRWTGEDEAGRAVGLEAGKINETLRPVNDCLSEWDGFPRTHVIPEPPINSARPSQLELGDYQACLPEVYVRPMCHDERGQSRGYLDDFVREWLKDSKRQLLAVLGDYGTGKTSFCYKLAIDLLRAGKAPVVIELKVLEGMKWETAIGEAVSEKTNGTRDGIVLILDAFDELSKAFDKTKVIRNIERLSETAAEYSKVILTSRTQFFRSRDEEMNTLIFKLRAKLAELRKKNLGHRPLVTGERFERIYISPFEREQVMEYLQAALGAEKAEDFWNETIEKVYDIRDLVRRPILLHLIASEIEAFKTITGQVTPRILYEIIVERWKEREEARLPQSVEVVQAGVRIPKEILLFMEELAFRMQQDEIDKLHFNTLREAIDLYFDEPTRRLLSCTLDNLDYQVRDCTFLNRNSSGYYTFCHESFIEYFVARKVAREIPDDRVQRGPSTYRKKVVQVSDEVALFVSEMIPPSVYENNSLPAGVLIPEDMAYIPPGQFIMGGGERVWIASLDRGYFMDKYPVTNAQFSRFLNDKHWTLQSCRSFLSLFARKNDAPCRLRYMNRKFVVQQGYDSHPVLWVTWEGANEYAAWAGKRLPTEQEWEKAARGIDGRVYPWGSELYYKRSNTCLSGCRDTTPVMAYPNGVSPYGCFDMVGNVWEWTASLHEECGKVIRGGSWESTGQYLRCSGRRWAEHPGNSWLLVGFRCAKSL